MTLGSLNVTEFLVVAQATEPTAIFILWDDWGGWFDHVKPPAVYAGTATSCPPNVQPNGCGCGYVYGFRVPLLVVSQYTPEGTISGKCGTTGYPPCGFNTSEVFPYVHDFGSILAFTENNFNMPQIAAPYYADVNALDNAPPNVPLSEFFNVNNKRNFTNIQTQKDFNYFRNYPGYVPTGPDDDSEVD